jgi:2,3-bisphosphoglycerate-independent phosphoglycerate mutase
MVSIINNMPKETTMIISSDHGNIEDLSNSFHTKNDVPFICIGTNAHYFSNVSSIVDVTPAILSFYHEKSIEC